MKKTIGLLVVVGAFGLGLAACGDKTNAAGSSSAAAGGSGAPKSGGAAATGIKECDDLIKKYDDAIAEMKKCKIPEAGKAGWDAGIKAMEDGKKTTADAMKAAGDTAEGKKAAGETCKASMAAVTVMPCPAM